MGIEHIITQSTMARSMRIIFDTNQLETGQDITLAPVISYIYNVESEKEEVTNVSMTHLRDGVYSYDYKGDHFAGVSAPSTGCNYIIKVSPGGALADAVQVQEFNYYN